MKKLLPSLLLVASLIYSSTVIACSPCGALSNVTQNVNGSNLELTFSSNAGWNCCYTVQIEIVCENANFSGVANYLSQEICINGGTGPSTTNTDTVPYPLTVIDLSNFCPGTYKWRAWEIPCNIYTPTQTFVVAGASPILLDVSATEDTICFGDNTQFSASASGGCNNGTLNYSWSPATGLNNPNIANPVASPAVTTTYTCTVTESGSCTAPQTADLTITINPLPTATISGTTEVCQGDDSPLITLTGSGSTAPYTINYSINGFAENPVVTSGNSITISVPTVVPGTYVYGLIDIQDASATLCSQNQTGTATITVNPLPVVEAGEDLELCEPNNTSPSEITLSGSGALTYEWDNGAVNDVAFIPPGGVTVFTVIGTDVNGCQNTDNLTVTSYPLPVANGAADLVYGNVPVSVNFSNLSQGAVSYVWDFGDGNVVTSNTLNDVFNNFTSPGIYTVTLTASNGICYDTWTIEIEVLPPMVVTPPNVFTPNGDGVNDDYFVDVKYGEKFEAIILHRWGNLITTLNHLNQGWNGMSNGKMVEDGVYFIKYKATDFAGHEIEGHTFFELIQ